MGRRTIRKDGVPMTAAERQARRRKRVGKSLNLKRRRARKAAKVEAPRRHARAIAPPLPVGIDFRQGDCRVTTRDIADNSVELIITDLPYGIKPEPLYRWLADFAARVLIPGGTLVCYCGSTMLPRDMAIFAAHLQWRTEVVLVFDDKAQKLHGAGVIQMHRSILVFTKKRRRKLPGRAPYLPTVIRRAGGPDKSLHAWGQGEGGCQGFIEYLTDPGELVVDPFSGSGTFARIAHSIGRRVIACDLAPCGTETIAA
jgi:DNA modification methylase